ncbi:MAG: ATP synthase F1 subunit gamma [Candidatus Promineifilaceae bacterium]
MASELELNKRIRSVRNIAQVTNALSAVSAAKAAKAQQMVQATRAYAGKAYEILLNLAGQPGMRGGHPLLTPRQAVQNSAVIVISGDRGLAGAYNANLVSQAEGFVRAIPTPIQVIAVGRKGRDLMIRRGRNVIASFDGIPDEPSITDAAPVVRVAIDDYLAGKTDNVFIAYTDFVNLVTRIPQVKQLLPMQPLDLERLAVAEYVSRPGREDGPKRVFSYEPAPDLLLDIIVPRFIELQVYQAILEAKASEHSARMVAMNNATDNAAELIDYLILERNKARQTSITNEILDIVGGAEALAGR